MALVSQNACFCFGFLQTASEWLKFGATDGLFSWYVSESGLLVTLSCLDIGICLDCSQGHSGQGSQVGTNQHSLTPNSEIPAEQLGRQEAPFCALSRFSTQNSLLSPWPECAASLSVAVATTPSLWSSFCLPLSALNAGNRFPFELGFTSSHGDFVSDAFTPAPESPSLDIRGRFQ